MLPSIGRKRKAVEEQQHSVKRLRGGSSGRGTDDQTAPADAHISRTAESNDDDSEEASPVIVQRSDGKSTDGQGARQGETMVPGKPASSQTQPTPPKHTIRKLVPPRPFPTVPASVSATGPRSAHTEGKNYICVTRKTQLGAYLRRCKDAVMKDGYKTLYLSAMGAAIPHLVLLTTSLPSILPFPPEEISTKILTGTVEVQDEVIPEDEDEDIEYRTRGKSSLSIVITIGDGVDEGVKRGKGRGRGKFGTDNNLAHGRSGQSR